MADLRNVIRWSSEGVERVKKDYADLDAAQSKTEKAFERSQAAARKAGASVEELGNRQADFARKQITATSGIEKFNVGLAAMARYAAAATAASAALMVSGAVRAADSYKGLQNSLRVTGLEADALAAATNKLFDVSMRTGTSVEANATLYARLTAAQKDLGASSDQLFTFTEAVSNALKINGTEASAATGALLQLSQALGGSKIQAQEYNSLIDGMRPLLQAVANNIDAAGGSVSKLTQLVKDGSVSSRDFFEAGVKGAAELAAQAEKADTRTSQAMENVQTAYIKAAGESDALRAATDLTTAAIEGFGESLGIIFEIIDEQSQPLLGLVGVVGDLHDGFNDLTGKHATVKDFFETVYEAANWALNPVGALAGRVGALQDWLADRGEWKASVGRGWAGSVGGFSDKYGGSIPTPGDKPDLPEYAANRIAREAEKAARAEAEWQKRVAEGWIDIYDRASRAAAGFADTINQDVNSAMGRANDAFKESQRTIQGYISDIERETELIGLSNNERERRILLWRLEEQGATDAQKRVALDALEVKQAKELAQKAADEVERIWEGAARDIEGAWSDLFYDAFNDGELRFKDFAKSLKSIWARTVADMLAMSMRQSIIAPMFQGLFGIAMPGAGASPFGGATGSVNIFDMLNGRIPMSDHRVLSSSGGWGGAFDAPDTSVSDSMGGLRGGWLERTMGTKVGASTLGGILGGGMMGMAVGGIAGSGQAGAVGGMIGTAIGGPIGSMIGGLLGGLFGSLFKSTPRSISSIVTKGGLAGIGDSMAIGLDEKIGRDMAGAVSRTLNEFADELGLALDSDTFIGMIGQRGKNFFYQSQQSDLKKAGKKKYGAVRFEDAESAIAAAIEAAIDNGIIEGLSEVDRKLLDAAGSVAEGMQKVIAARDFRRELDFQYLGLSDPLAERLARLELEYQEQLKLAEEYEADKTKLEAVYAAKRKAIIEDYNAAQNAAMEQALGGLKDFLTSITSGSASPLSPTTRLMLAQQRYGELAGRAKAGDKDAIAELSGAARDYLDAGRDVYASGSGYMGIYNQVVGEVSGIVGVSNPLGVGAAANQNVAQAVNDNGRAQISALERSYNVHVRQQQALERIEALLEAQNNAAQRAAASAPTQNGVVKVGKAV